MARRSLRDPKKHDPAHYAVCDHATPVLYGDEDHGLELPTGRSPGLDTRNPRLHRIAELTAAAHEHFVGRTWQLAGLGSNFIGSSAEAEVTPVAAITGLGGMGKTALAAEALSLWESRFEWVLLYQAKPNAMGFEATLRDIHMKLYGELRRYHEHVQTHPADAIHRPADAEFTGPDRLERLTRNLIRALRDEPILLLLDNFETNLASGGREPAGTANGGRQPSGSSATKAHQAANAARSPTTDDDATTAWACQDPAWDRCLGLLVTELVETSSRVLITCRRPLAALAATSCQSVLLGPLPADEAALYLREYAGLSRMFFSDDEEEYELARRLLHASRFHPLLMDRLARLATGGAALRPQLMQALEALEQTHDYSQLPELFATQPGDAKELAYLNDALVTWPEQLIHDASPDARRLLWMIAVANEPISLGLLRSVWGGESHEQEQLRQMKQMLEMLPMLPPELQEKLKALPQEVWAAIDALPPEAPARPNLAPLLRHLVVVGLVTEERSDTNDDNPDLTCHELVRERIGTWMQEHPQDRGELTENAMRLAYAERLQAVFNALQHQNMTAALQAGSRALVYCVQAGAYDRLGRFASDVVTSTSDPRLLESLLPHLEAAAESAPAGKLRWSCLCYLADALSMSGRPDASLPFYEQANIQARTAAEAQGEDARQAWSDLVMISGNWANALRDVGDLDASLQRQRDSAEASTQAGQPAIYVVGSELEALRIDIIQGRADEALPEVEVRLSQVEAWWKQHRVGRPVADAPDPEFLARVLTGALNVATQADFALGNWETALRRSDTVLDVKRVLQRPAEEIAGVRLNRAIVLMNLCRFAEAKAELEDCLQIFRNSPTDTANVLSSLAGLLRRQGDVPQAVIQERRALAFREQLPDPSDRVISHGNLANYLELSGTPSVLAESRHHRLADLIYCLVTGLGENLQTSLGNYAVRFRRAQSTGVPLAVPRVAELLADPAFRPLDDWLRQRGADPAEVQAAVDQLLDQARQATES